MYTLMRVEAYETLHDEESRRNYDMQIFGMDKVPFRIAPMLKQVGFFLAFGTITIFDGILHDKFPFGMGGSLS